MSATVDSALVLAKERPAVGAFALRVLANEGAAAGVAFASVASLAVASGGYFAPAWGWSGLALLWVAALTLVLRDRIRVAPLELAFVGGLVAFGVWAVLSASWGASLTTAVREGQRSLVYVAAALAALLVCRAASWPGLVKGAWAAAAAVSAVALSTRLFAPEPSSAEGYRLGAFLDYWNALGILAGLGFVLALGLAAREQSRLVAATAAAATVPLAVTLYFTFGRGPWVAIAAGLAVALALDPRRVRLMSIALVVATPAVLALWLASGSDALTHAGSPVAAAESEGRRLALALALLAGVAAAAALAARWVEERVKFPRAARRGVALTLVLAAAAALALGASAGFGAASTQADRDLSQRLFDASSSGRVEQWRVAWEAFQEEPLVGSGAGTYERTWLEQRPTRGESRDAHSLYLETLAELGLVGAALLLVALGAPLAAAARARRQPLVPIACGAYVAYLVHAGLDWDWEMPAVTIVALFCACALLAAGRRDGKTLVLGLRARAGVLAATVALGIVAFVGLMANRALEASEDALAGGRIAAAEAEARTAIRWAPWSSAGWDRLAQVRFSQGDLPGARVALLEAVEQDSGDWGLWYDLGVASQGRERLLAYREAARLNPRSRNVAVLRTLGVLPPLEEDVR